MRADEPASPPLQQSTPVKAPLTEAQIDELLAPVALYPDALIAIILPASTFPTDVVLAARYLESRRDAEGIESQPWDDSVKALARYPEVLKWMDENLAWTRQLGETFVLQPAAILSGTQRLRAAAIAAGNLKNTPEQTVVVEREVVRIEPATREVIYVPVYDPVVVYRPRVVTVYEPATVISFSNAYPTGLWLSYSCDWNRNTVVYISQPYRQTIWLTHPSWVYPGRNYSQYHRDWCPDAARVQVVQRNHERRPDDRIVRPGSNPYVQTRPGRDAGPERDAPRTADTRDPGRGRGERPGNETAGTRTDAPAGPASPTVVNRAPDNRNTPPAYAGGRDRNWTSQSVRNDLMDGPRGRPGSQAPDAAVTARAATGPVVPSGVVASAPASQQLTLQADASSNRRRSTDNTVARWNNSTATGYAPPPSPATGPVVPSGVVAPAPASQQLTLQADASSNRGRPTDNSIARWNNSTATGYAPPPAPAPERPAKISLKSAPAYAQENRRESRAERKAQEAQQAASAQAAAAPAASSGSSGTVVAEDAQTRRRDRR